MPTDTCTREDRVRDPILRVRRRGFEEISWERALDEAERLLREADGRIVTALSGSETVEQAYALGKLLRRGLGAHTAFFAEEMSDALDAFRVPLSAIRDADVVAVLGDGPVVERAPVVDLWIKEARRRGARVLYELDEEAVRSADRAILIWCGHGGHGGATVAALAQRLGASGAFYLPDTANGRGVCDAWSCADDAESPSPDPVGLLIVSGDEAAANPDVRALAEKAERVIVISMFQGLAAGWADLLLPGTSYLERDGTYVNLEGRIQRLRRTVIPPVPDELAWISKLAERFERRALSLPVARVRGSLGHRLRRDPLRRHRRPRAPAGRHRGDRLRSRCLPNRRQAEAGLRLVRYRPLFSGPAVDRVPRAAVPATATRSRVVGAGRTLAWNP